MRQRELLTAAIVAGLAGTAMGQVTINGVLDMGEDAEYGPSLFDQNTPTEFGDNETGNQIVEVVPATPPEDVDTGIEVAIPLADLGNPATLTSIRVIAFVNSGGRDFAANQFVPGLVFSADAPGQNQGNFTDFNTLPFNAGSSTTLGTVSSGTPIVDGTKDALYAGSPLHVQTTPTGFGDSTSGTPEGGGGSELDNLFAAADATNLYLFIGGNIEANGNAVEILIDTDNGATGTTTRGSDSTATADFAIGGNDKTLPTGFAANYFLSVDRDTFGGFEPRLIGGPSSGAASFALSFLDTNTDGYGAEAVPDASGFAIAVDNSNAGGVTGDALVPTPVNNMTPAAPDANYGYGSEIDNVRGSIDEDDNVLRLFIAGNSEINQNKLVLLIDAIAGEGQNILGGSTDPMLQVNNPSVGIPDDPPNALLGTQFDAGFDADYYMSLNTNRDGDGIFGQEGRFLVNFIDSTVLRTNGPLSAPIGTPGNEVVLPVDYGVFFGGPLSEEFGDPLTMDQLTATGGGVEVINYDGRDGLRRLDIPSGSALFGNFPPRTASNVITDPANQATIELAAFDPSSIDTLIGLIPAGLIEAALDNSNVGGVTGLGAMTEDVSDAANVTTGWELAIDLDELGWNGTDDIKVAGFIASANQEFISNQVIGGLPDAMGFTGNLGSPPIDFTTLDGTQFVTIGTGPTACNAADIAAPFGQLDLSDVQTFLIGFGGMDPVADIAGGMPDGPDGMFDLQDVQTFLIEFGAGCP